ncbi:L-fucose isomerase [Varibaculum massiliense]|uniref:L-fucose isomerase n=1 Tax=Varibaculum massiliense TaxID=1852372 RepID=UPI00288BB787|nr:L-fucose isomerase [Varibaculum massiliense]
MKNPIIAIRPTIDGRRRGVRESLEDQTMDLAKAAGELISANLKYPDGKPVEVYVYPHTIGRAGEAAECDELLRTMNVAGELTVTSCWNYVTEVMNEDSLIQHAIWGFNGTERPGAVFLAAALAAYSQIGIPAFGIYGKDVQDADNTSVPDDVAKQILQFAQAALAVGTIRGKNYLQIGSQCMGIAGSVVNHDFVRSFLGMGVESVDMTELARRIELGIYDPEEFKLAREFMAKMNFGEDRNLPEDVISEEEAQAQLDFSTKMWLIARDLLDGNEKLADLGFEEEASGHNAIVGGFQGQRQWTDFYPNGDVMETMLNTSFDWTGPKQPHVFATENDHLNGITMLFNHLLTNRAQMFSDVRTYWSADAVEHATGVRLEGLGANGFLDLRNSGATTLDATGAHRDDEGNPTVKPWYEITQDDIDAAIAATTLYPSNKPYFRGGGFSTAFYTEGDLPVTMARINLVKGIGPVLQIAEGWTLAFDRKAMETIVERTDPTWPTTFFVPRLTGEGAFTSVYEVMNNWGANHGAIGYGHFGGQLITLASMLRIPVNMHNVETDRIFRPRYWSLMGTSEIESADYRACATLGPLYR